VNQLKRIISFDANYSSEFFVFFMFLIGFRLLNKVLKTKVNQPCIQHIFYLLSPLQALIFAILPAAIVCMVVSRLMLSYSICRGEASYVNGRNMTYVIAGKCYECVRISSDSSCYLCYTHPILALYLETAHPHVNVGASMVSNKVNS
jgi:hypothetical protein